MNFRKRLIINKGKNGLRKYGIVLKMALLKEMQYKVNFLLGLLSAMIPMLMSLFMWQAVYKDTNKAYGYSYIEMLLYTILAVIISQLVSAGFASEIATDIKSGELSKFLCEPIGYVFYRVMHFLGSKVISMIASSLLMIGILKVFESAVGYAINSIQIVYFIGALLMAMGLNFMVFLVIGLTAFWFVETFYLFWALKEVIILTSGGLFPLEVYGTVCSRVLNYLPFKYTTYFPINILLGKLSNIQIQNGMRMQLIWILILGGISFVLWRRGIKEYVSIGG